MCCINRRMPRVLNNCNVTVNNCNVGRQQDNICVPPQNNICGAPANVCATPAVPQMAVPNNMLDQNQIMAGRTAAVAQANIVSGQCQNICDSQVEVVIEPAMVTAPNIINHHRRVEHIVPVITEDIHQHHTHHEFVARPEQRIRQTFDADVRVGPPLMTQQVAPVAPVGQQQVVGQPQLVPLEVDVIERFGVNPNQMGTAGLVNQGAAVNPALLGQMSTIAGQTFATMPNTVGQGFIG